MEQGCPEKRAGARQSAEQMGGKNPFLVIPPLVMEGLFWGWVTDAAAAAAVPPSAQTRA